MRILIKRLHWPNIIWKTFRKEEKVRKNRLLKKLLDIMVAILLFSEEKKQIQSSTKSHSVLFSDTADQNATKSQCTETRCYNRLIIYRNSILFTILLKNLTDLSTQPAVLPCRISFTFFNKMVYKFLTWEYWKKFQGNSFKIHLSISHLTPQSRCLDKMSKLDWKWNFFNIFYT